MSDLADIHDMLTQSVSRLDRLASLTKHRLDNQNHNLRCMYYSLDEQFLLLCDLVNIVEKAIDPTSPYPFTLRLTHRRTDL